MHGAILLDDTGRPTLNLLADINFFIQDNVLC